ncbi:cell division protein ZapE [Curvivirga sp.]|uniref:cell division protein ZapE n=1 Tax=Curvivirga sp. TaxID=2856848 RepID=UPI003B5CA821
MSDGPLHIYREKKADGHIRPDGMQALAVEKLQSLHNALKGYEPDTGSKGWKERFGLGRRKVEPPLGLYMYGGVGRGKSMIMDLFYETAPVEKKRRVHFHEFMIEIQEAIQVWRKEQTNRATKETDPLPRIAQDIAANTWLLCFDEFHVTDITNAMILGRLFSSLFELGVVVVATSNWAPNDLYKDGLQRESFLPFIDLLKEKLDILHLDSPTDYRLIHLDRMRTYHAPLGSATSEELEKIFGLLTEGARIETETLTVKGRNLEFDTTARGVLKTDFERLCAQPLGAEDYIRIAERFHTIVMDDVPTLSANKSNEAKRFMMFVDALYEHSCNLIMGADGEATQLYPEGKHAFEFERTVSRLIEMQSKEYLSSPHKVLSDEGGIDQLLDQ